MLRRLRDRARHVRQHLRRALDSRSISPHAPRPLAHATRKRRTLVAVVCWWRLLSLPLSLSLSLGVRRAGRARLRHAAHQREELRVADNALRGLPVGLTPDEQTLSRGDELEAYNAALDFCTHNPQLVSWGGEWLAAQTAPSGAKRKPEAAGDDAALAAIVDRYPTSGYAWLAAERTGRRFPAQAVAAAPSWPADLARRSEIVRAEALSAVGLRAAARSELAPITKRAAASGGPARLRRPMR